MVPPRVNIWRYVLLFFENEIPHQHLKVLYQDFLVDVFSRLYLLSYVLKIKDVFRDRFLVLTDGIKIFALEFFDFQQLVDVPNEILELTSNTVQLLSNVLIHLMKFLVLIIEFLVFKLMVITLSDNSTFDFESRNLFVFQFELLLLNLHDSVVLNNF